MRGARGAGTERVARALSRIGVLSITALMALASTAPRSSAQPLQNTASGTSGGTPLDLTAATITLNRLGDVAATVTAEIAPNGVVTTDASVTLVVDIVATFAPGDAGATYATITLPAGFTNPAVSNVRVDDVAQQPGSPAGPDEYEVTMAGQALTITFGTPMVVSGTHVQTTLTARPPATGGITTFGVALGNGALLEPALQGDADGDPGDANSLDVEVFFSRGQVIELTKYALDERVSVGDVVTYVVELRNTGGAPVVALDVRDEIPASFEVVEGSARLDGAPLADPSGDDVLSFTVGTLPGLVDDNGNGEADPGESGYRALSYQLIVGSGAALAFHENVAVARDGCEQCIASNVARARVEVVPDVDFDLGTIVGKVFDDADGDGVQERGELGVPEAMVVLDDGTYAITDAHGRYHFPQVTPGQRLVKLDLASLPGARTPHVHDVAWVTPGLVQRVSFGVQFARVEERIGSAGRAAVAITPRVRYAPVEVRGSVASLGVLLNDRVIELPACDATLRTRTEEEVVELVGTGLPEPILFDLSSSGAGEVHAYAISIYAGGAEPVRVISGSGPPPATLAWDGLLDGGRPVEAGAVYQYQLELLLEDGSRALGRRRLFGINRTSIISLNLTGEAFDIGSDRLSDAARRVLAEAAVTLREHTGERVVIEGHTDDVGTPQYNLELSRRRAEAAAAYLKTAAELSDQQVVVDWFGEARPVAPNDNPEGRALNRRVEVKGHAKDVTIASISDQYRTDPVARIEGKRVYVGADSRFSTQVVDTSLAALDVMVGSTSGQLATRRVPLPRVRIHEPVEPFELRVATAGEGSLDVSADGWHARTDTEGQVHIVGRVRGRTDPTNRVEMSGRLVPVDTDGRFEAAAELEPGANVLGLLVRNETGATRIVNLDIFVATDDADGRPLMAVPEVPALTLDLPPEGATLGTRRLPISGRADPSSRVTVNGTQLDVDPDGRVHGTVDLPGGESTLVAVVTDPEGRTGRIERRVDVPERALFLLAFADARFGARHVTGDRELAGQDEATRYTAEGRLAFYLKGHISGRTLITAALDTRDRASHDLFENLADEELARLGTTLDPDRMYPVYGDGSRVVYDAESQGKLYVAIEGPEARALVGNYEVRFSDTELAGYTRTLFGGRFHYASTATGAGAEPATEIFVFGSESRHAHVRDLLRATGGSLYYLSHDDVVEGSEQITLVVRDAHTGLTRSRRALVRNVDYSIKHLEGRLLFRRPVMSVAESDGLSDADILGGDPVFIEVDYETRTATDAEVTGGARVRREISRELTVGATYVDDAPESAAYELMAADAEIRLGPSRLVAEVATTEGADADTYVSSDGGLTFAPAALAGGTEGDAWKAALELDVGRLIDRPGDAWVRAYAKRLDAGFFSAGNRLEQGTSKLGISSSLALSTHDHVDARVDREERLGQVAEGSAERIVNLAAQWRHTRDRWHAALEYRGRESDDPTGDALADVHLATARIGRRVGDDLEIELERQQTLSGARNDQTTLGATLRPVVPVALSVRGTEGTIGRSLEAGAELEIGERRVYVTERIADGGTHVRSSVVGVEERFSGGRVYSEYQWGKSGDMARATSLLGAERRWPVASGLTIGVAAEVARTDLDGVISDRTAISTLAAYEGARATVTTRHEVRLEDGPTDRVQYLTASRGDLRLVPDFSVAGTMRYSRTRDRRTDRTEARLAEHSLGLAYRPVAHDRVNALARYTRRSDLRPGVTETTLARSEREMDVVVAETIFALSSRFEWVARAAARILAERVVDRPEVRTHTYLGVLRLNTRLWHALELGTEYRLLTQREADDRLSGWLTEVTYDLGRHLYAGGGYNFTDFSDDEFRMHDYSVHGWFVRLQGRY